MEERSSGLSSKMASREKIIKCRFSPSCSLLVGNILHLGNGKRSEGKRKEGRQETDMKRVGGRIRRKTKINVKGKKVEWKNCMEFEEKKKKRITSKQVNI